MNRGVHCQRHLRWPRGIPFPFRYARQHDLPYRRHVPGTRFWQFGWGGRSEICFESSPMEGSAQGKPWARDKGLSKQTFRALGVPAAPSIIVRSRAELEQVMRTVGFPCVTKPLDCGRSQGVTTDIRDHGHLVQGFREAARNTAGSITIERHVEGEVHRMIVVRGRLWKGIRPGQRRTMRRSEADSRSPPSVGWACGGRTDLGSLTFPAIHSSVHQAMDRLVKHPGVASLILVADPAQLTSEGLPASRTSRTVVLASAGLDPTRREVATRHDQRSRAVGSGRQDHRRAHGGQKRLDEFNGS